MSDLRSFDDYTYAHSVNVAVLACTIGFGMNLPVEDIEDIVLAGLLHDLGKLDIPEEILNIAIAGLQLCLCNKYRRNLHVVI